MLQVIGLCRSCMEGGFPHAGGGGYRHRLASRDATVSSVITGMAPGTASSRAPSRHQGTPRQAGFVATPETGKVFHWPVGEGATQSGEVKPDHSPGPFRRSSRSAAQVAGRSNMTISDHADGHDMRGNPVSRSDILTFAAGAGTSPDAHTGEGARENRKWCMRQRSNVASRPQS